MPEISVTIGGRLVPKRIVSAIVDRAPFDLSPNDEVGREILHQWEASSDPDRAAQAPMWNVGGVVAWILTGDLAIVSRMLNSIVWQCRRGRRTLPPEYLRVHELACLKRLVHKEFCSCPPSDIDWQDCQAVYAALEQLRANIDRLGAVGGFAGADDSQSVTSLDILGLRPFGRQADRLEVIHFAPGLEWAHFRVAAVIDTFPVSRRVFTFSDCDEFIDAQPRLNQKEVWQAWSADPGRRQDIGYTAFHAHWSERYPDRKPGRPPKLSESAGVPRR